MLISIDRYINDFVTVDIVYRKDGDEIEAVPDKDINCVLNNFLKANNGKFDQRLPRRF